MLVTFWYTVVFTGTSTTEVVLVELLVPLVVFVALVMVVTVLLTYVVSTLLTVVVLINSFMQMH